MLVSLSALTLIALAVYPGVMALDRTVGLFSVSWDPFFLVHHGHAKFSVCVRVLLGFQTVHLLDKCSATEFCVPIAGDYFYCPLIFTSAPELMEKLGIH